MRTLPSLLLLLLLMVVGKSVSGAVSEESILRDCQSEYAKGEYGSAIKSFSRFLRNYPQSSHHAEVLYWRGQAFLSEGRQDSAKGQWSAISERSAPFWYGRARFALAVLAAGEGNEKASNDELTRSLRTKDSTLLPSIWYQFHKNFLALKQSKEASKYADSLKKKFPRALETEWLGGEKPKRGGASTTEPAEGRFTLQLGAFQGRDNAEALVAKINGSRGVGTWKAELVVQKRHAGNFYIVRLGRFSDEESARSLALAMELGKGAFRVVPWSE